jgi:hypothetical protein
MRASARPEAVAVLAEGRIFNGPSTTAPNASGGPTPSTKAGAAVSARDLQGADAAMSRLVIAAGLKLIVVPIDST